MTKTKFDGRSAGRPAGRDLDEQHAEEAATIGRLTCYEPFTSETLEALDPRVLPATLGVRLKPSTKSRKNVIGSWVARRVKTGHIEFLGTVYNRQRLWQVTIRE